MNKREVSSLIYTFVLGDGGVFYSGKNARYQESKLAKHLDYMEWKGEVVASIAPASLSYRTDARENRGEIVYLMTHSHPFFTAVRERMYIGNRKGIDPHSLVDISWCSLACLYMDDGTLLTDPRSPGYFSASLEMNRFSYPELYAVAKALHDKLGVSFKVSRKGKYWKLCLSRASRDLFFDGITPFVFPSFEYKLPLVRTDSPSTEGGDIVQPQGTGEVPKLLQKTIVTAAN